MQYYRIAQKLSNLYDNNIFCKPNVVSKYVYCVCETLMQFVSPGHNSA